MSRKTNNYHPGFTLIEVLIVIMIVVVMAVLTMSISRNFMDKAYMTGAINSMRQVASANASYAIDNNSDINVPLDAGDTRYGNHAKNSFWGRLVPYLFSGIDIDDADDAELKEQLKLRLDGLFGTPDSETMTKTFQKGAEINTDGADLPMPFAFNTNVYDSGQYVKTHAFRDPARTLYMAYGFELFDEADGATYAPIPKSGDARTNNIDWFSNKTAAFTFLDGHVEILSPPVPARRFKDPGTDP